MLTLLGILQIVVCVLLVISVLLQNKGGGLGAVFGGQETAYQTKRGAQKFLHIATIILVIFFLGLGVANLLIS